MSDKIANFEDYKKKEMRSEYRNEGKSATDPATPKKPVPQETMNIEIEDPYQFLNAQEREEYIRVRQEELESEKHGEVKDRKDNTQASSTNDYREQKDPDYMDDPESGYEEDDSDYDDPDEDEDYDQEYDEEEAEEASDEEQSDKNILILVRAASIITGLVILIVIGMVVKTKVIDRYLIPDPDEVQTVVSALPTGFTEKNDTVVVTGASSLNLRSGPDTSSSVMDIASEGTELKRIAVNEDGSWALVEYEGQQVYASMKYLKEK